MLRIVVVTTFALIITLYVTKAELSIQEKIKLHKEWLEKKAALKSQLAKFANSNSSFSNSQKNFKFKNLTDNTIETSKLPKSESKNWTKNDVYPELDNETEITTKLTTEITFPSTSTSKTNLDVEIAPNISIITTIEPSSEVIRHPLKISEIIAATTKEDVHHIDLNSTPSTDMSSVIDAELSTEVTNSIMQNNVIDNGELQLSTVTSRIQVTTNLPQLSSNASNRTRVKKYPRWGPWSKWSQCSRSCGGGVMYQSRRCISRKLTSGKRVISKECAGLYRRYHLCNEQDCPSNDVDFRYQQCSNFDDVIFQGKKYKWEPYVKADAECELNCKPIDMKYFATLNETVIDGTPCFRPAEYYRKNYRGPAVCVEGICKAIHANGVITGSFANSGTIHCGTLICRPISGIFSKNPLPGGYAHVAIIPPGASNISITELKSSPNILVLKIPEENYIFNGGYTLSQSGTYEAAGTMFDYHRLDGFTTNSNGKYLEGVTEWITSTGPTLEPVQIMVFGQDTNPGIKYEYLLPIISNSDLEEDLVEEMSSVEMDNNHTDNDTKVHLRSGSNNINNEETSVKPIERRRRRFNWKVVGFSPCSKSCGGGNQTPIIRCVRESTMKYYTPRRCSHSEKPVLNENLLRCNTQPCPAYWKVEDWTECICHDGEGFREREIHCVQELATGVVIQINNAGCMEEEPISKKKCECPRISRRRPHRQRLHAHAKAPDILIANNNTLPKRTAPFQNEKSGTWLVSDWNDYCSVECGSGVEYRSIFCDRTPPNTDRCDLHFTPDSTKPCENNRNCDTGEWFTGPWGKCSGDCFNLMKSRQVICIRNQLIVDDDECRGKIKPETSELCSIDSVDYCKPRWHYSSWSDCSKTCGGGTQKRTVKCLEIDLRENTLKESQQCKYSKREAVYRQCNIHKCQEVRVDLIQNDIAADCIDEFTNCHLIVKAKLCSYEYYQQNCCYSCRGEYY